MEPWFGNHGNVLYLLGLLPSLGASMEPWFGNHGNSSLMTDQYARLALQWSRGSVTTETRFPAGPRPGRNRFNGAVVR